MTILCTILMVAILCTVIVVVLHRDNIIIKSASPLFCILELCGLALTVSWIYFRGGVPAPGVCRVGLLVPVIGLTINLSALVVKNYRIYRIFNSVSIINHAVSNHYLLRVVAMPVVITFIPCIVHCFVDYFEPKLVRTNNSEFWAICSSSSSQLGWAIVIGIIPAIMILFGIFLAFKTRNVTRLWNEARSIALTIYMLTFFVIIIIIVQTFPSDLYQVTYHVTMVCILVSGFLEYIILFYPKLKNLWLQRHGLHVPAGRGDNYMDNIMGTGIPITDMRRGGKMVSSGGTMKNGGRQFRSLGNAVKDSEWHSVDMQGNPNISDLVSSYPFGQLSGENCSSLLTSPVHRPTNYGQSSLLSRGHRKNHAGDDQDSLEIDNPQLTGTHRAPSLANHVATAHDVGHTGSGSNHDTPVRGNSRKLSATTVPMTAGYNTFGQSNAFRPSRDIQPLGSPKILAASSNEGSDSDTPDFSVRDFYDSIPELNLQSRKNSFGGFLPSRSPQQYPFQALTAHNDSGICSLQEMRMDSFTVVVPVQRHRWYIIRFLAQWRMSRVIFVPCSKLMVLIDVRELWYCIIILRFSLLSMNSCSTSPSSNIA
ncbi:7 transmembrane sweet-taste receptor of 3 GCPR-domain-containing protein [Gamsiella multidivaricata]|uniref:7 transmembrane sweet-taste receptor of 3 GCPR-domain-containing protein n=1 Tax=Gamsiella multidivaricata TaxID=101098 RepID=UPI002220B557|nr:7 transmembrane sweet-taste receptor of 3 GCPR-domain-containing protein [Gamsiella multidivaricata]KAI7827491.1 7 transmembrane sweet-taste receptor of 3 GCPR-domain-containing protein [Gamsiella multidivaricata]